MTYQKTFTLFRTHWFGDYRHNTHGMTHEQKGIYIDLLDQYWLNECQPLPMAKLHKSIGCTPARLQKVLELLHDLEDDGISITFPKIRKQWAKAKKKSDEQAANGAKGGSKPRKPASHLGLVK